MIIKRILFIFLIKLFCALHCLAQDSFTDPYSFSYNIDFSSELTKDSISSKTGMIETTFNKEEKISYCRILYENCKRYEGRIIDMQLYHDRQEFTLEKFTSGTYNAKLIIVKSDELSDKKIALIYYTDTKDQSLKDRCICMILSNIETVK